MYRVTFSVGIGLECVCVVNPVCKDHSQGAKLLCVRVCVRRCGINTYISIRFGVDIDQ